MAVPHPRPEVLAGYAEAKALVLETTGGGAGQWDFSDENILQQAWRQTNRRYWQTGG